MSYHPYPPPLLAVPARQCSTAHVVIAWVVTFLTFFYMLPWAIAATRNRSNVGSIALINALLGWSLVGWVVALVMACGSEPAPPVVIVNAPQYHQQLTYQAYPPRPYQPAPLPQQQQLPQWTQQPPTYAPIHHHAPPPALYGEVPVVPEPTLPLAFGQASFDPSSTLPEVTRPLPAFPFDEPEERRRQ